MRITKTFQITFDEPCPNWLCADNLAFALHSVCTNTQFEVVETARNPEYPEEGFNEDDEEIDIPPEEASEEHRHMLRGGAFWDGWPFADCSYRSDTRPENNLESSGFRIAKHGGWHRVMRSGSWDDEAHLCRSAKRSRLESVICRYNLGFRISRRKA